jgi:uncharacterized membrane protein YdjX (TVP38/TMEM64 family)
MRVYVMAMCGVFFKPLLATIVVFTGGTIGSILAYGIARQLAKANMQKRKPKPNLVKRMRENTSFASLFALRICPGVPHAAINYTAGALHVPIQPFVMSTAVGFLAKGLVYTTAVYRATHTAPETGLLSFSMLWPLIALLLMAVTGILIERRIAQRRLPAPAEETHDENS